MSSSKTVVLEYSCQLNILIVSPNPEVLKNEDYDAILKPFCRVDKKNIFNVGFSIVYLNIKSLVLK